VPITPGKVGYVLVGDTRIDFAFDGAPVEEIHFAGFSPLRAFAKGLTQDPFFKTLVLMLMIMTGGLLHWANQQELKRPEETIALEKVQKTFARYIPKLPEEPRVKTELAKKTSTASESKPEESDNKQKEEANKKESTERRGYGEDAPGEGVNLEKVGVLALIGGVGASDQSSNLMESLISRDLAKGLDKVMTSSKNLSAGRGQSGTDVNALLAYGMLGEGTGGNSSIDDILKSDVSGTPAVKLEKTGKVSVENLGKVSGSEEAKGARTEESLRGVLTQYMGRLQYIYNKYLKTNSEIGGKVEIEVTINADGSVANVAVLSSEIAIPDFQREIVSTIRRWKYEVIAQGQVKVVYPIIFNKIN
jgi:TonB family protein